MMRRTPMKRTAFKPKGRAVTLAFRDVAPAVAYRLTRPVVYAVITDEAHAIRKDNAIEHEGYRRLVAALPCIRCGIEKWSQCAHPNTGKAKGMKADDRECFPLCCTRPGIPGCHFQFDQHQLGPRELAEHFEQLWAAHTRETIRSNGDWPKSLPFFDIETNPPA